MFPFHKILRPFCLLLLVILAPANSVSSRRFSQELIEVEEQKRMDSGPNLLFSKCFVSDVFAVGWELVVQYKIFNVGDLPATNVHVYDPDFVDDKVFLVIKSNVSKLMQGEIIMSGEFNVPSVNPGKNLTFILTAMPIGILAKGDLHQFHFANISYQKGADDERSVTQIGWSSLSHHQMQFLSQIEADRRYKSKKFEILFLILLMLPSILCPYSLWMKHTKKYDALQRECDEIKNNNKIKRTLTKKRKRHYH